jgi:hypothetical protein
MEHYLDDLNYEQEFIGAELKKVENRVRELLVVKSSSPLVLHMEPMFAEPNLLENVDMVYIGETKAERPHGTGVAYYKSSKKVIYGSFHNGHIEGRGELYFNSGDYYIGEFKADKKEGRGLYKWSGKDANIYEGEFKGSKRNGRGIFWWGDGSRYEGQFKDGVQSGYGILYRQSNEREYEGNWANGMFDGQGVQYFENG